jgi:hypothetical protein
LALNTGYLSDNIKWAGDGIYTIACLSLSKSVGFRGWEAQYQNSYGPQKFAGKPELIVENLGEDDFVSAVKGYKPDIAKEELQA